MTQYFLGLLDSNVMLWTNSKAHKRVYTVIWDFSSSNGTISKIPYSWFAKGSVIYDTRKVFKVFEHDNDNAAVNYCKKFFPEYML